MSQKEAILSHLRDFGKISARTALDYYGSFRLAARIKELRDQGHEIQTEMAPDGYAVYTMANPNQLEMF